MAYENANIETIARGVCVQNGKLLVCQPKKGGRCYLPGGHIEFGETARTALVREIREEMGVEAQAEAFLAVCENTFVQNGEPHCEINLVFTLVLPPEALENPKACEDWITFSWVPCTPETLKAANLLPAHLIDDIPAWIAAPGQHKEDY